jgi:hypothetical protein
VLSASTISMSPPVRLTSSLLRRAPHGRSFARNTRSSFCSCGGDAHFFYRHSRASRRCPLINRLDGIYLYDIDDLQSVASFHLDERGKEVELAEAMIAAEVEQYQRRLQAFNVVPEIVHLQRSLEEIRQAEHRRLQSQLQSLSPEQAAAVEMLARSLVNKLLHHALQAIKIAAKEGNTAAVDAIRQAFGLHLTGRYGVREHPFAHPASAARVQETETEESRTANTITLKGHTAQ